MSGQANSRRIVSMSLAGEVATKSGRTRRAFRRRLCANIAETLARHAPDARLQDRRDRIDVVSDGESLLEPLSRVFGIQAVRPAYSVPWRDLDDIVAAGSAFYGERVAGRRFAVYPRRVGPRARVPVSTDLLARRLGQCLVDAGGAVDLDNPEVPVHVEVRTDDALLFDRSIPGPGGLPAGVEGRALALISGGFDSAVAAWQMLGRGVELDFLLFNLGGWPHEQTTREVLETLDRRWMAGTQPRLYIVDLRPAVAEMRRRVAGRYWQVLLKRIMLRAADHIADASGAEALVTGEAIGQVSSQTLSSLGAVSARTVTPVLRPLVGYDKGRITELAEHVGTAGISAGATEFCALEGGPPATRVRADQLDREEERVGYELVATLARRHRVVPRTEFGAILGDSPEIAHIPEHAAVIDVRTRAEFEEWAWPDAIHLDFDRALEFAGRLPADRPYLFYCEVGLKSAWLAETMRGMGYEAYSFRGGAGPMQRHARDLERQQRLPA